MQYLIHRFDETDRTDRSPEQILFQIPGGLEEAPVTNYPWDPDGFCPRSGAFAGWDEKGLHVFLYSLEPSPRMEVESDGGPVWEDSCLEFFLNPDPEHSDRYLNMECSPRPCFLLGLGTGRNDRIRLEGRPGCPEPEAVIAEGTGWSVKYLIPSGFLLEHFGVKLHAGLMMKGNFYKCGDRTPRPHFGMWNPADITRYPEPDFHRPENFGWIRLQEN